MIVETATYFGPARVIRTKGIQARVSFCGQSAWATLAIPFPYQPREDDVLLVLGQEDACYAIGVIQGRGTTRFIASGDLEFHAPKGEILFSSSEGVNMEAPEVSIEASTLEFVARKMVERFGDLFCWVKGLFQSSANRERHVVEEKYNILAEQIEVRAEEDVKIDGTKINLG
jgi:hypothetical protein